MGDVPPSEIRHCLLASQHLYFTDIYGAEQRMSATDNSTE
jgi:hypothetical protein